MMLSALYLITYLLSGRDTYSICVVDDESSDAATAVPRAATSRHLTPSLLLSLHPFLLLLLSIQRLQLLRACSVLLPNLLQRHKTQMMIDLTCEIRELQHLCQYYDE